MDLVILCLGKTREINQKKIIEDYIKKINFFLKCRIKILTNKKKIQNGLFSCMFFRVQNEEMLVFIFFVK